MTAKCRWEKNKKFVVMDCPLAAGSTAGKPGKTRHCKSAAVGLMVLSLLCTASLRAAAPRYQVIDLGSLGGPNYYAWWTGVACRLINNNGTVVGGMETSTPDPFCFNGGACLTSH